VKRLPSSVSALLCLLATAAGAAEPLSAGQRHARDIGTALKYVIPAGGLVLTAILDPADAASTPSAGHHPLLLMGGSPRHDLLLALGRNWVVTSGLKYAVDEDRPNGGSRSFPSGHTSMAFTGAEFIRKEYGWGWAAPAYVAAGFVGWSRVYAKKHYTHDVVAGAVLGVLANHDFWLPRTEGGSLRLSAATFQSGRALAPGLRLDWTR
jgi:hypothetical protein